MDYKKEIKIIMTTSDALDFDNTTQKCFNIQDSEIQKHVTPTDNYMKKYGKNSHKKLYKTEINTKTPSHFFNKNIATENNTK